MVSVSGHEGDTVDASLHAAKWHAESGDFREPLCDVVIAVHNRLDVVDDCLRSVLAHTAVPVRILVIDDASNDYVSARRANRARKHRGQGSSQRSQRWVHPHNQPWHCGEYGPVRLSAEQRHDCDPWLARGPAAMRAERSTDSRGEPNFQRGGEYLSPNGTGTGRVYDGVGGCRLFAAGLPRRGYGRRFLLSRNPGGH